MSTTLPAAETWQRQASKTWDSFFRYHPLSLSKTKTLTDPTGSTLFGDHLDNKAADLTSDASVASSSLLHPLETSDTTFRCLKDSADLKLIETRPTFSHLASWHTLRQAETCT
jgi:hypothetical protein